jgi:prepilin-type N-terminal cleavage/methylation domain-containing protein
MAGRKGFTLTELLVCVAVLAVLLAMMVPTLARVRAVAMDTVCTSRLRDLVVAATAYRTDFHDFPKLGPGRDASPSVVAALVNLPQPQQIDAPLLNALAKYLNVPRIGANLDAADLPPLFQCPMFEGADPAARDSLLPTTYTVASYYTGYAYVGRVDEQPPMLPLGVRIEVLRPERPATHRNSGAGVLWVDDVHWSLTGSGACWTYGHRAAGKSNARPGAAPLSFDSPAALGGQHRGYADGHVEWVRRESMGVGLLDPLPLPGYADRGGATLRIAPVFYLWF